MRRGQLAANCACLRRVGAGIERPTAQQFTKLDAYFGSRDGRASLQMRRSVVRRT
jgi:hypothetical protein